METSVLQTSNNFMVEDDKQESKFYRLSQGPTYSTIYSTMLSNFKNDTPKVGN